MAAEITADAKVVRPSDPQLDRIEGLLGAILHELRLANWQRGGGKGPAPERTEAS